MDITSLQATLHPEDEALRSVRARVGQAVEVPDVGTGALLAHVADQHGVRHAVVAGSAGGIATAWLLAGMVDRGIVTCIEADGRRHALMTDALGDLGIGDHVRLIHGDPVETSRRLSDSNYDLVLLQGPDLTADLVDTAARLLKVGGVVVIRAEGEVDDAAADALAASPWVQQVVLDSDGGIVICLRDHDEDEA
ncbi:MAG TPA: class I SAM-dependent methyltransferase [Nitriliruptoraceae bacterium]|nr:class I SAM-dependent methyltransferase [Nitriliruptoraceae bacterium]